jgi:hypothetical protein
MLTYADAEGRQRDAAKGGGERGRGGSVTLWGEGGGAGGSGVGGGGGGRGGGGGERVVSLIGIPGVSDAVKWVEKAAGDLSVALEELSIYVASYYYICVRILQCMCPDTTVYV